MAMAIMGFLPQSIRSRTANANQLLKKDTGLCDRRLTRSNSWSFTRKYHGQLSNTEHNSETEKGSGTDGVLRADSGLQDRPCSGLSRTEAGLPLPETKPSLQQWELLGVWSWVHGVRCLAPPPPLSTVSKHIIQASDPCPCKETCRTGSTLSTVLTGLCPWY